VHFGYRRDDEAAESRDAARWLSSDEQHRLVLRGDLVEPCFEPARLEPLGLAHRDHWFLAARDAVRQACRAAPGQSATGIVVYQGGVRVKSATPPRATARSAAR
jgi:hypothetical protein